MNRIHKVIGKVIEPIYYWTKGYSRGGNARSKVNLPHNYTSDYGMLQREFRGTPRDRSMAAEASSYVMRCIEYRINEIKSVDWAIYDSDGNEIEDHPFTNAYIYAWAEFQQDLFTRWMLMRLVHGEVYIEKLLKPDSNLPGGLYVLNSEYIEPEIMNGHIQRFNYAVDHHNQYYEVDELFCDRIDSIRSDIRGKSPMDRALLNVNVDLMNYQTIRAFLLNDNKPSGILSLRQGAHPISDDRMKQILENFKKQGEGIGKGYSTRVVPAEFQLQSFDTQAPDIMLSEDARKAICTEFGIDPALIGASITSDPLGASTTLQEKRIITLIYTIRPDLKYLENYINHIILPWIAPNSDSKFKWDYSNIDTRIKYTTDAIEQARFDVDSGLMTVNEYREKFRFLPPIDGADALKIESGGAVKYVDVGDFKDLLWDKAEEEKMLAAMNQPQNLGNGDENKENNKERKKDID